MESVRLTHQPFHAVAVGSMMKTLLGNQHRNFRGSDACGFFDMIETFYRIAKETLSLVHHIFDDQRGLQTAGTRKHERFSVCGWHTLSGRHPTPLSGKDTLLSEPSHAKSNPLPPRHVWLHCRVLQKLSPLVGNQDSCAAPT